MKIAIFIVCAVSATSASPASWRIVGGDDAAEGQFPYQISLRNNGSHSCGGSILDQTTILCAAHCFVDKDTSALTVRVGNNKLSAQTEKYAIDRVIVHEDYTPDKIFNDICIIKLATPIKFRAGVVEPVKLRQSNIGDNDIVTFSGWGRTSYPGPEPNQLQYINLKTIAVKQCAEALTGINQPVFATQLCTLTRAGQGACYGDSGGPLVDENKEQIGVFSWGRPCAVGFPDVFSRVYSYLEWIEANRY